MARILVAEDDVAVRDFVERGLKALGHGVTAVTNGGDAFALLQQDSDYSLLLTDIVMPVMDGIALALKVADSWPDLPILMMTGFSHERQRAHNLDALITEVIEKPFTLDQLDKAVKRALQAA